MILIKITVTVQIKILDGKIKSNQAHYDLGREAGKISALSSKDILEKYEYLTGEDLGQRPSALEKAKFEYSPLGMSFSKAFEKDKSKSGARSQSDFNYDKKHALYKFYKGYDEFEEMSLDSKYNRMKKFNKLLTSFQAAKTKNPKTQLKKVRLMENIEKLYKKYYDVYKNDYDANDESNEAKKKYFDYTKFELVDKIGKRSKLDGETKKIFKEIENREKDIYKKGGFMEYFNYEPTALVNKLLGQNTQDLKKVWTRLNNRR